MPVFACIQLPLLTEGRETHHTKKALAYEPLRLRCVWVVIQRQHSVPARYENTTRSLITKGVLKVAGADAMHGVKPQ